MRRILMVLIAGIVCSCGSLQYMVSYSVGLSSVESPANAKERFGETKVVNFSEEGLTKYRYEDDYIDIIWYVGEKQFNFTLKNKSGHTIKINWDDVVFVDHNGKVERTIHSGVKYIEKDNSHPASVIPNGASITDLVMPSDNVFYSNLYKGWREAYLIPCIYDTKTDMETHASKYVGKIMTIMMPILIEDVQNDYTFKFSIDKINSFGEL